MGIFAKVGVEVRVLQMHGAKDPDEFIKTFGADKFAQLLKKSRTGFDFKLESVLSHHDISKPEERIRAAAELCDIVSRVYSAAEREVYLNAVAERLGLTVDSLRKDVERIMSRHAREGKQQQSRQAQLTASALGDKINPEAAGNVQAAATEQIIIGLLLLYGEHRRAVLTGQIPLAADGFVTAFHRRAFEAIMTLEASDGGYEFSLLGEYFSAEEMGRLARLERARRDLSENGTSVLRAAVETLARERERQDIRTAAPEDAIGRILESKRKKINKQ